MSQSSLTISQVIQMTREGKGAEVKKLGIRPALTAQRVLDKNPGVVFAGEAQTATKPKRSPKAPPKKAQAAPAKKAKPSRKASQALEVLMTPLGELIARVCDDAGITTRDLLAAIDDELMDGDVVEAAGEAKVEEAEEAVVQEAEEEDAGEDVGEEVEEAAAPGDVSPVQVHNAVDDHDLATAAESAIRYAQRMGVMFSNTLLHGAGATVVARLAKVGITASRANVWVQENGQCDAYVFIRPSDGAADVDGELIAQALDADVTELDAGGKSFRHFRADNVEPERSWLEMTTFQV